MNHAYVLNLSCPDRTGIVHAVSGFLLERGGNIEEAAQYNDHGTGLFFMRVQFACDQVTHEDLRLQLRFFAEPFAMQWSLHATAQPMRTVLMVSKEGHCLNDLLFRWKSGLLPSGHPRHHQQPPRLLPAGGQLQRALPPHRGEQGQQGPGRSEAVRDHPERRGRAGGAGALHADPQRRPVPQAGRACHQHPPQLLPSFKGAKPYYQAHDRGVKLIGATAHYVTADLDEGPIIEQDVARVDHSKTVEDLTAMGRDTESQVLARAVKWHSEHRILVNGHKTVIFK
jgi:formyltetrahydrofolate deformylase